MNSNINTEYSRLVYEDIIWVTNILIALANIKASSLIREAYLTDDLSKIETAQTMFKIITLISIIINIYFVTRNYTYYNNAKSAGQDTNPELLRFIGSMLILIGTILIFYSLNITDITEGTPDIS